MRVALWRKRYRRLFDEVWGGLSSSDQKRIDGRVWLIADTKISKDALNHDRGDWAGIAGVVDTGFSPALVIYLQHKVLKDYSDDEVRGVIAHELAHAWQGFPLRKYPEQYGDVAAYYAELDFEDDEEAVAYAEYEADELTRHWGFETPIGKARAEAETQATASSLPTKG